MALTNFIPTIWSARLLLRLQNELVYGQPGVINRDYEGEIGALGDTVRINDIGDINVFDYTRNTPMADPQVLTDATTSLQITQSKAFNFAIDDLDKAQGKPAVMDRAMQNAAYALKATADSFVASKYVDVDAGNIIGSDGTPKTIPSSDKAYEFLVDLATLLNEDNVPEMNRWVIVPAWFHGVMLKDPRFIMNPSNMADTAIKNGKVAQAAGFDVLLSNNVPNVAGAKFKVLAGHAIAWSYAEQISKIEAYRPEKLFADGVKGLHLYGAKVVKPKALAMLIVDRPA